MEMNSKRRFVGLGFGSSVDGWKFEQFYWGRFEFCKFWWFPLISVDSTDFRRKFSLFSLFFGDFCWISSIFLEFLQFSLISTDLRLNCVDLTLLSAIFADFAHFLRLKTDNCEYKQGRRLESCIDSHYFLPSLVIVDQSKNNNRLHEITITSTHKGQFLKIIKRTSLSAQSVQLS